MGIENFIKDVLDNKYEPTFLQKEAYRYLCKHKKMVFAHSRVNGRKFEQDILTGWVASEAIGNFVRWIGEGKWRKQRNIEEQ